MGRNQSFHVDSLDWIELSGLAVSKAGFKQLTDPDYTKDSYSLELTRVGPEGSSHPHTEEWAHLFYVLSGQGELEVEGEASEMRPGSIHPVAAGQLHSLRNTGESDLVMLAIYHPPRWR